MASIKSSGYNYSLTGSNDVITQPKEKKSKYYIKATNINDNFCLTLDFIRDLKNTLGIVKHMEQSSSEPYLDICPKEEKPIQDTYHNIQHQIMNGPPSGNANQDTRNKRASEHTIYLVIELSIDSNKPFISSIKNFNDLGNEKIEFPIKIRDLAITTKIGFSLYDMSQTEKEGFVASTTLSLFDSKRRLRQGVIDLYLWKDIQRDLSFK